MLDLSESLRLSVQAFEQWDCLSSLPFAEGAAGVTFLSGLRARLEQPLRLLQRRDDRLEAAMRAGLAANHRVANAVMAAALQTDALAQRAQGSALAPALENACRQLSRIGSMVTEVRAALSDHEGLDGESVDWRSVVEVVAGRRNLKVVISGTLPARVLCAQGGAGLARILDELADNVPDGATACVEVRPCGPLHVCLAIVDDGPGLALAAQSTREPFTSGTGAAGVGLFLVDCLAKASGGRLEVSAGEKGGTFAGVHLLADHGDG